MHKPYNLRSSHERQCHYCLQRVGSRSPETMIPRVYLEKLNVLECNDLENCRFYLKGDKVLKIPKTRKCSSKKLLKMFCISLLLIASLVIWKDDLEWYGGRAMKQIETFKIPFHKFSYNFVRFFKNDFKELKIIQNNRYDPNSRLTSCTSFKALHNQSPMHDFAIKKLVKDHVVELQKNNKYWKNEGNSFIKEECERGFTPKNNISHFIDFNSANFTDYALESQGAKIVSVFNTEPYGIPSLTFFHYNFGTFLNNFLNYFTSSGPSSILVPWKKAGDCWAFKGSYGRVEIKLWERVIVTAVTIDHIPKDLAPGGIIKSAPRKFFFIGIDTNGNQESARTYLGEYEYTVSGPSLQTFSVKNKEGKHFNNIEFVIESNHGNDLYTCIYKIRVHGYK